jgi:hypothetical protein
MSWRREKSLPAFVKPKQLPAAFARKNANRIHKNKQSLDCM